MIEAKMTGLLYSFKRLIMLNMRKFLKLLSLKCTAMVMVLLYHKRARFYLLFGF